MDKPRWGNKEANRLHRDKPEIPQLYTKDTRSTKWRGNMEHQPQHAAIVMNIQLHYKKHYFRKTPVETGAEIRYNIKHAKNNPNS